MISDEATDKSQLEAGQDYGGCPSVVTLFFAKKILNHNRPVCWSIVEKEIPNFGSPVPSDRIPKATKDVNVQVFIHSSNSCIFYQRISGTF